MHYPFPSHLLSLALAAIRSCRYRCRHRRCRRGHYRGCSRRAYEPLLPRRMADEAFWRRYGPLFRRIRREYPGFWEELREVAERHRDHTYTTHGARVQNWPETRNAGVQVGAPLCHRREAAAQIDRRSTPPRPMLRVPATPRRDGRGGEMGEDDVEDWNPPPAPPRRDSLPEEEELGEDDGEDWDPPPALPRRDHRREEEEEVEDWNDPPPAAPREDWRPRDRNVDGNQLMARRGGPGCWNCGSRAHRYSACPHPRRAFCYGCGRQGVTLRDCTNCAEEWRRLGPYHPDHGHARRRE